MISDMLEKGLILEMVSRVKFLIGSRSRAVARMLDDDGKR